MLDDQLKQDLLELAELTNRSMSDLVREFVAERVEENKKRVKRSKKMSGAEALLELAKRAEEIDKEYGYSGPTDWSVNHDHYLYGLPKKKK